MRTSLGQGSARRGRRAASATAAGVAASVLASLCVTLLPAASATAATITYGATITQAYDASGSNQCRFDRPAPAPVSSAPTGGASSLATQFNPQVLNGSGTPVAALRSGQSTGSSVVTAGGGLSSFSMRQSSVGVFSPVPSISCGSNQLLAAASPYQRYAVIMPVVRAGWLDLSASVSGATTHNTVDYSISVLPPGVTSGTPVDSRRVTSSAGSHVYLPAGYTLGVVVQTRLSVNLTYPDSPRRSAALSVAVSGRVTPVGAAVNSAHGARLARRSVLLPSAVSCAGSARVKVTRAAKKKAKSVTFLVNGHKVRRLKRINRARALGIRVPTSGPITITATVVPKHGRKVRVSRSYAACR